MKKVLILSYYWPPAGGPGVQRFLKFAKFLPEFGWEPIIITPANGSYPVEDKTLIDDVPEGIHIIKTKTFEPFALYNRLTGKKGKSVPVAMTGYKNSKSPIQSFAKYIRANFFVPDARIGWNKYAYSAALKAIKGNNISAIITTGPPHSTHLVGNKLKNKTKLPWIADFRDPWTTVFYNNFFPRSERTKRKDFKLETHILQSADLTTVISPGLFEEFQERTKACDIIYNGYDEADFTESVPSETEKFTLSYIGNLKPNQNVSALWLAIAELSEENKDFQRDFILNLTGAQDPSILNEINALGIQLKQNGFVNHQEATKLMLGTSALLFIVPQSPRNHLILTGKIFEYLASKRPIFGIGPVDGNADELMKGCSRSGLMDYDNKIKIKSSLLEFYLKWKSLGNKGTAWSGNEHFKFTRRGQTNNLAKALTKLISNG